VRQYGTAVRKLPHLLIRNLYKLGLFYASDCLKIQGFAAGCPFGALAAPSPAQNTQFQEYSQIGLL
jgi:hypothetical protein